MKLVLLITTVLAVAHGSAVIRRQDASDFFWSKTFVRRNSDMTIENPTVKQRLDKPAAKPRAKPVRRLKHETSELWSKTFTAKEEGHATKTETGPTAS